MSKTTNRNQYVRLVSLMTERPDLAQGFSKDSKENVMRFWENASEQLNSLGPPTKDTSSWKKVWLDYKSYIKRKLSQNKAEFRATGGGPNQLHKFNELEESVIKLTGLETCTSGVEGAVVVGLGSSQTNPAETEFVDAEYLDQSMRTEPESPLLNRPQSRDSQKRQPTTAILLEEQVNTQKEYYRSSMEFQKHQKEKFTEIATSLRRLARVSEKMYDLEKEKIAELRRHNLVHENLQKEELDIKMRMLQIEESQL